MLLFLHEIIQKLNNPIGIWNLQHVFIGQSQPFLGTGHEFFCKMAKLGYTFINSDLFAPIGTNFL
jgi:hypothetical protein